MSDIEVRLPDGKTLEMAAGSTVLDIADRQNPEIVQTTEIDGGYVSSRAIEDHIYLVSNSDFGLPAPEVRGQLIFFSMAWMTCSTVTMFSFLRNGRSISIRSRP